MTDLEELKQDMDQKRKTADAADAAYEDAYAAYEDAAYVAAKKKYEAALEQASATSSERVSISRECAKREVTRLSLQTQYMSGASVDNMPASAMCEKLDTLADLEELKAALDKDNE